MASTKTPKINNNYQGMINDMNHRLTVEMYQRMVNDMYQGLINNMHQELNVVMYQGLIDEMYHGLIYVSSK